MKAFDHEKRDVCWSEPGHRYRRTLPR